MNFYFIDPQKWQNYLCIMRTFLNHIKNETLDEIETSLENLWQRMIQLSAFFIYSFVLILKQNCLVGASWVHCGKSGTPSTIIYTRWSSRHYDLGCHAPVWQSTQLNMRRKSNSISIQPSEHFHIYFTSIVHSQMWWQPYGYSSSIIQCPPWSHMLHVRGVMNHNRFN